MARRPPVSESRYRWLVLAAATFAQAATGFAFLGVGALAGFFREEFDLTGTQTGLIMTAVGLVPVFALVPVGRLLDRHGERGIIGGGALFLAAGVGIAALSRSYPMLLLVLLVGGAGYATSQPGGSKAVAGWFSVRDRGPWQSSSTISPSSSEGQPQIKSPVAHPARLGATNSAGASRARSTRTVTSVPINPVEESSSVGDGSESDPLPYPAPTSRGTSRSRVFQRRS